MLYSDWINLNKEPKESMKKPMRSIRIKLRSTVFMRGVVLGIGAVVGAICLFALPPAILSEFDGDFDYGPILLGLYVPAIPYFYAIFQTLKLLNYIDNGTAFSNLSTRALRAIKYCGVIIAGLFILGAPYVFYVADRDDAPGVFALDLVLIGASLSVAVFAAVLQRLLYDAIEIKEENDLTV
jgi:hypothetical protein